MTAVFRNGRFFTASVLTGGDATFAECMTIRDGVITHVGHLEDPPVTEAIKAGVVVHDMANKIVLPSFIDGHMHMLLFGLSLSKLSLDHCKNLEDIRNTIKAYAEANKTVPRILCRGWMHSMTDGEALASALDDLDPRPIFIDSKDLHSTWCNTAALEEMGCADMVDPAGGTIHRGPDGKPSGLLSEAAALSVVWPHVARVSPLETRMEAIKAGINAYTAGGYTGMVEMAMDQNAWDALCALQQREKPPVRIAAHWVILPSKEEKEMMAQVDRAIELNSIYNAEMSPNLRIAGIKVICDGVIDACTAALIDAYSNGATCGPLWTPEMLKPVVTKADAAGLQCALHAIGDGAIRNAIDALEYHATPGLRHRIEHLELASAEDAVRLGKLGITASIQPVHADPAILKAWPSLLGEKRCGRAFAYKEFLDNGALLALGTDAPTAPYAALPNLYTATTRRSARQPDMVTTVNDHFALSLATAVSAATAGAAYSCFADGLTGKLEVGLKADFVVVDMAWDPSQLLKGKVQQTWFEGKKVYEA